MPLKKNETGEEGAPAAAAAEQHSDSVPLPLTVQAAHDVLYELAGRAHENTQQETERAFGVFPPNILANVEDKSKRSDSVDVESVPKEVGSKRPPAP
jgi:hypothetical protein